MWKEVVVAKYTALISHYFGLSKNKKIKPKSPVSAFGTSVGIRRGAPP